MVKVKTYLDIIFCFLLIVLFLVLFLVSVLVPDPVPIPDPVPDIIFPVLVLVPVPDHSWSQSLVPVPVKVSGPITQRCNQCTLL